MDSTLNSGADREAIARVIDPDAFKGWEGQYANSLKTEGADFAQRCADHWYKPRKDDAFAKADAILSLSRAVDGGAVFRSALEQIASFSITPDTGYSVAQAMRRNAEEALALPRVSTGGAAGEPVVVAAVTADGRLHVNDPPIPLLARPVAPAQLKPDREKIAQIIKDETCAGFADDKVLGIYQAADAILSAFASTDGGSQ